MYRLLYSSHAAAGDQIDPHVNNVSLLSFPSSTPRLGEPDVLSSYAACKDSPFSVEEEVIAFAVSAFLVLARRGTILCLLRRRGWAAPFL